MRNSRIAIATTPEQIRRCHPVIRELRPLFQEPEQFVERVLRQHKEGYQLAFLESEGEVCAVAGYRFLESLFSGKFLYVDDLVARFWRSVARLVNKTSVRARLRESRARFRRAEVRCPSILFFKTNEHFILPLSD